VFHHRLGTIAVMHFPIHHEHTVHAMHRTCGERGYANVPKQAEPHSAIGQCVVAWRPHRTECPANGSICHPLHCFDNTAQRRRGLIPRAGTHHGLVVQPAAALSSQFLQHGQIFILMANPAFIQRSVSAAQVLQPHEQLWIIPNCTHYCTQPSEMLGVAPPGIVRSAVAMRNEGYGHYRHASPRNRREAHSARRARIAMPKSHQRKMPRLSMVSASCRGALSSGGPIVARSAATGVSSACVHGWLTALPDDGAYATDCTREDHHAR